MSTLNQAVATAELPPPENDPQVMSAVYNELRALLARLVRLSPDTELSPRPILEALQAGMNGQARGLNGTPLFALAAPIMRRFLIDQVVFGRAKNKSSNLRVVLGQGLLSDDGQDVDLLQLDEAIDYLEITEPPLARIAELRLFGGLGVEETAEALQVTVDTVHADWANAQARLLHVLSNGSSPGFSVAFSHVSRVNALRRLQPPVPTP